MAGNERCGDLSGFDSLSQYKTELVSTSGASELPQNFDCLADFLDFDGVGGF
jgi:hypothetical protein